jgi:hypothetical protein
VERHVREVAKMTKRYREPLDEVELGELDEVASEDAPPASFRWRGQHYQVLQVLGHWREDPGWWRRTDGTPMRIEQTDLWRVEAGRGPRVGPGGTNGVGLGRRMRNGVPTRGVYELVRRGEAWRLDRVWD